MAGGETGNSQVFMRGISAPQGYMGMESAIGVYLDEVPISEGVAQPDLNDEETCGARISMRYQPSERWTLDWMGSYQDVTWGGTGTVEDLDGSFRDLEQYRNFKTPSADRNRIYNFTAQFDGDRVGFTSSTSYMRRDRSLHTDITGFNFLGNNALTPSLQGYATSSFTQETRFSSPGTGAFTWLLGGYYGRKSTDFFQDIDSVGAGALFGLPSDQVAMLRESNSVRQAAVFGEVGYSPSDDLTLTAGLRYSRIETSASTDRTGLLAGGAGLHNRGEGEDSILIPKVNVAYKVRDDALVYVQATRGYRTGGQNAAYLPLGDGFEFPASYGPDSLWNYEVGLKGVFLERRLNLNMAAFYIDWKNIQLSLLHQGYDYFANAGNAVSKGLEVEGSLWLTDSVQVGAQVTYTDSTLSTTTPGVGNKGDRVPNVPRLPSSGFLEFGRDMGMARHLYARFDVQQMRQRYAGSAPTGSLTATSPRSTPGSDWIRWIGGSRSSSATCATAAESSGQASTRPLQSNSRESRPSPSTDRAQWASRSSAVSDSRRRGMGIKAKLVALVICIAAIGPGAADAQVQEGDPGAEIRAAIEVARALPDDGINEDYLLELGGLQHRISVRGASRNNPILLFLHGGPGSAMLPPAWPFQRAWEDYFTVVHWDQRGAGRTGFINDGMGDGRPVTTAGMQQDAEDLIRHLLAAYGQEKLFLMGHSWGTLLGVRIAQEHPEWLHAYIGVGQVVDAHANETLSYQLALAEARRQGAEQAVEGIRALAPYPPAEGVSTWQQTLEQRRWVVQLGGLTRANAGRDLDRVMQASPDYTDEEADTLKRAPAVTAIALWSSLSAMDLGDATRFEVPVFIFAGRHDMMTPSQLAADWFERVDAPVKRFFWFEKSAHYIVNEEPGVAFYRLVRYVLPMSAEAP